MRKEDEKIMAGNPIEQILKPVDKLVDPPKGKGMQIVPVAISGIGFDALAKVTDNFLGSPFQRFGISLPIIGRLSLIDIVNYFVHNHGKLMPQKDFKGPIAVLAAKGVQTGFNLGNISGLFSGAKVNNGNNGGIYAE